MRPESSHLTGGKGESYDTAPGETIDSAYKAEPTYRRVPLRIREAVKLVTAERVFRFNHLRLLEPIGYSPPTEANYCRQPTRRAYTVET